MSILLHDLCGTLIFACTTVTVDDLVCPMEPGETVSVIGLPVLDIDNQTVALEVRRIKTNLNVASHIADSHIADSHIADSHIADSHITLSESEPACLSGGIVALCGLRYAILRMHAWIHYLVVRALSVGGRCHAVITLCLPHRYCTC